MKVCALVQARMGSSRFPGKVLKPLVGKPILKHVTARLQLAHRVDKVYVITSYLPQDDPIERFCHEHSIDCFRGDPLDVLKRYNDAAKNSDASFFLRITADCPLMDPDLIDSLIDLAQEKENPNKAQLFTNVFPRSFPRGLDCELLSRKTLDLLHEKALPGPDREHVTLYAYEHPELFEIHNLKAEKDLSYLRVTVDEPADLLMIEQLLRETEDTSDIAQSPYALCASKCIAVLEKSKKLQQINALVKQKYPSNRKI